MPCKNCGYRLSEESKFCPKCGYEVKIKKENFIGYLVSILLLIIVFAIGIFIIKDKLNMASSEIPVVEDLEKTEEVLDENDDTENINDGTIYLTEENVSKIEELIVGFQKAYSYATNIGAPSEVSEYVIYNSEAHNYYQTSIPDIYSKGITISVLSVDINNIEKIDDKKIRASIVTEFEISNSEELRYQKESIDYIIEDRGNGLFGISNYENFQMLDKYTIEKY